jgi:ribosomal protein L14
LLPLDVLLGWILTNDKRQRIFNRVSDSIVVMLREAEDHDTSKKNNICEGLDLITVSTDDMHN